MTQLFKFKCVLINVYIIPIVVRSQLSALSQDTNILAKQNSDDGMLD